MTQYIDVLNNPYLSKQQKIDEINRIGEARVIFNPDDIEIVRKYYNQPDLYDYIRGFSPTSGAISSNLYEKLKN